MASLATVASVAGVSKATVSRVVNELGNVHPDTVRQVRRAIDRVGYQAPLGKVSRHRRLKENYASTNAVYALLVPEIGPKLYMSLLRGFEAAATEKSFQSIICNTGNNLYKQGHELLQLIHRRVSGVAMVPVASMPTPLVHLQAMESAGIPVVLLHRDVEGADVPLVSLPLERAGYLAGQAMLAQGHRRIAMLAGPAGPSSQLHRAGLEKAIGGSALSLRNDFVRHFSPASASCLQLQSEVAEAVRIWDGYPSRSRPTAVYVTNDAIAETLFMHLLKLGRRVPEDFSIVSFGGEDRGGIVASQLTAVVVDEVSVGRAAIDLIGRAACRAAGQRSIHTASVSLAAGTTLGPVEARRTRG